MLAFFGGFTAQLDGQALRGFESDKARALLAYLAVEAGSEHNRARLAGLLWPEQSEEHARASLSQALYNLRGLLGDRTPTGSLSPAKSAAPFLSITPHSLGLDPESDTQVDVRAFQELLSACKQHAHLRLEACPQCLSCLTQAVQLYRGDFLAGFSLRGAAAFEEWALIQNEHLRQMAIEAIGYLAQAHEGRNELQLALEAALRQVAIDPLWEDGHRRVMRTLWKLGQRAEALAQYAACRKVLHNELGIPPDSDTEALYQRIHYQDGQKAAAKHNLPSFLIPFIGRQAEGSALRACLNDPDCRLLTLLGPGGSGKTRLAIETARSIRDDFCDGVYLVWLNSLQSADALPAALVAALELPIQNTSDLKTQLLNYLRAKQILLVMDGFESLLDGASLAAEILQAAPSCKIFVTSRARLNINGEYLYPLEGLELPPPGQEQQADGYSAVQLFLEAARRVEPNFDHTQANLAAAAEICRLAQGMPLGLLLASAWMKIYTPQEIAVEIKTSLDFLSADWRDVPARQRSLRASFEYSWGLLSEREQRLLAGLSVFLAGFTRQAALAVTDSNLHDLLALVDKSLVQHSFEGRYQFHELIRQFAGEKLAAQPEYFRQIQIRHSRFYLNALVDWAAALLSSRQRQALEEMDREAENLRAAWRWAAASQEWQGIGGGLEGMAWYADLRLRFAEGERACRSALEKLAWQSFFHLASALTIWQAHFLRRLNQADGARKLLQDELERIVVLQAQGNDFQSEQARALYELGELCMYTDREAAKGYYQHSLALFDELNDSRGQALVLASLGEAVHHTGPLNQAQIFLERGVGLSRRLGDPRLLARCLLWSGWNHLRQGNLPEAEALILESIAINRSIGDRYAEAFWSAELGTAKGWMGHLREGCDLLSFSIPIYKELGLKQEMTLSILRRGLFESNMMEFQQARQDFQDCITLSYEINYQRGIGLGIFGMGGSVMQNGGDFQEAEKLFLQAIPILQDVQADEVGWCLALLVVTLRLMGKTARAWEYARQALDLAVRARVFHTATMTMLGIALLLIDDGQIERAIELHELTQRNLLIKNSPWFYNVCGQYVDTTAARLPAELVEAARARGRARDLFATAAELLQELSRRVDPD